MEAERLIADRFTLRRRLDSQFALSCSVGRDARDGLFLFAWGILDFTRSTCGPSHGEFRICVNWFATYLTCTCARTAAACR